MTWIPLALGRDIPAGVTRAVLVEGRELVVWRGASGSVQVWEDRCPHRGMRLSFGFVRGDALNCLYHGWQYGADSRCRMIPAHPDLTVPPTIRTSAFVSAERAGFVWTQIEGNVSLPDMPDATPVASFAVDAPAHTVLDLCGGSRQPLAQLFLATLDGVPFQIGWHEVSETKTMLHAGVLGAADPSDALTALRSLRLKAEAETPTPFPLKGGERRPHLHDDVGVRFRRLGGNEGGGHLAPSGAS